MSYRACILIALVLCLAAPAASQAACNAPSGSFTGSTQQLFDRRFEETSCSAWHFTNGATRSYEADTCNDSYMGGYEAKMSGASGAAVTRTVYQDINLPYEYSHFDVYFRVNIQGSMTAWDRLRVTIRNPSTNAELETVTVVAGHQSSLNCTQISKSLTGDYSGTTVRLRFESTIWTGVASDAFVIDEVGFYTSP